MGAFDCMLPCILLCKFHRQNSIVCLLSPSALRWACPRLPPTLLLPCPCPALLHQSALR